MSEEKEIPQSDALKAINDRLAELEDLQLVNKLDIINVKNELDRSRLAGGPSEEDMDKIGEMRELLEKSDTLKKAEKAASELEKLKEKISRGAPAPGDELRKGIERANEEIRSLREKIGGLEKGRHVAAKEKKPDLDELRERIGKLESAGKGGEEEVPEDVRKELSELKEKIERLESAGTEVAAHEVPEDVRKELSELKKKISGMKAGEEGVPADLAGRLGKIDEISSKIEELTTSLEGQKARITGIESTVSKPSVKKAKEAPDSGMLVGRIDSLEQKIASLGAAKGAEKARAAPVDMKRLDSLTQDMKAIKSRIAGIEAKASEIEKEPKKPKEPLKAAPSGDVEKLKGRMEAIERNLQKVVKLATGLKPIELPEGGGKDSDAAKELSMKVAELEKSVGAGVGEDRFRTLEKKMEEMREWLPEYISNNVKHTMDELSLEIKKKVKEVEELKEEMVRSTIEHLMAQPGTIGSLVGDDVKKKIEGLQKTIKKVDSFVKPSDAKLTSLLRQIDDAAHDIEKLKSDMKDVKSASKEEIEELAIDVKAINTRLDSVASSVKGVDSSGVTGVMRDLEILKTKADWLESTVHKLDLDKIYEKIAELEQMMRASSAHAAAGPTPIIIE